MTSEAGSNRASTTPSLLKPSLYTLPESASSVRARLPRREDSSKRAFGRTIRSYPLNKEHLSRETEEVPETEPTLSLDDGRVVREGSDVTVLTWGAMVRHAVTAVDQVDADVEIVKSEFEYTAELTLEETVTVYQRIGGLGESSIPFTYELRTDGETAATGWSY